MSGEHQGLVRGHRPQGREEVSKNHHAGTATQDATGTEEVMPKESTTPKFYVGKVVRYAYGAEQEMCWTIKSIHDLKGKTVLRLGKGRYDKHHPILVHEALVMASEVKT